ncbi:NAD(P)-dependent alcohol dehydrogenase [Enterovirga rhinocerotis]|uniref:Putative zinc-type alcohol dehydrogenase-like protein n=1 Tax=Enterovirga rhinocerotis TaxID=1339210 RepID=A0A4R7BM53_9HYPH|nr:NAD(P)-dependent alcohol dehydrogenase [Enterovirga rhinocerotis]TDR85345.1 putative zinc-type alcohol dehydrogenase-like protein [Enterovirga rhinocerotis]
MFQCIGYAATDAEARLAPFTFERRDPGPNDVEIEILFCGVCHSDLHQVRNEWQNTLYPCVPGHEIVGRVTRVGSAVTTFKAGDLAGVGCMVDSCRECDSCREGLEQYCVPGFTLTYNSPDKAGAGHTFGGYSSHVVVDRHFVLRIPDNLDLAAAAPLLCAGITTYSPLRHWKVGPGQKVGIAGLGGLGHMGVKLAHAMGARVVVLTTSASKEADARRLGADEILVMRNPEAVAKHAESFDFILDTIAAEHDINVYLGLLRRDATLVQVGAPEKPLALNVFSLLLRRRNFAGSIIGGIAETQEMLDFCGAHGITADIEMIRMDEIEAAYQRMAKSDVKYRFVIDMATLQRPT